MLLGCGDTAPNSKIHQLNPNAVIEITNTAEVSSTIFRKSGSDMYFCSSNSPDATFSKSSSNGISLTLVNFGDSVERDSYDSASSGDEMLGRTPAVLASRDILYRACELIGNLNLTPQEAVTFYRTEPDRVYRRRFSSYSAARVTVFRLS